MVKSILQEANCVTLIILKRSESFSLFSDQELVLKVTNPLFMMYVCFKYFRIHSKYHGRQTLKSS